MMIATLHCKTGIGSRGSGISQKTMPGIWAGVADSQTLRIFIEVLRRKAPPGMAEDPPPRQPRLSGGLRLGKDLLTDLPCIHGAFGCHRPSSLGLIPDAGHRFLTLPGHPSRPLLYLKAYSVQEAVRLAVS